MGVAQTVATIIGRAGGAALDLAVPRRCGLRGRFDTLLCPPCLAALPPALPPRCPTCWGDLDRAGRCPDCARELLPALTSTRSVYRLDGGARRLVHALKYDGHAALAEPMGATMAAALERWGLRPDFLVPVPLHPARRRARGFNQAARLAAACGPLVAVPVADRALRRTRRTRPQVRLPDAAARRRNVEDAFALDGPPPLVGRTVVLIDDVCTTAVTLRACARVLRAGGAASVHALTFARD